MSDGTTERSHGHCWDMRGVGIGTGIIGGVVTSVGFTKKERARLLFVAPTQFFGTHLNKQVAAWWPAAITPIADLETIPIAL